MKHLLLVVMLALPAYPQTPTVDKRFVSASIMIAASASTDSWSTNRNLSHGYIELNPILGNHPSEQKVWGFAAAKSGVCIGASYLAKRELRKSRFRWLWWSVPITCAATSIIAGSHNIEIYNPAKYPKR